MKDFKKYLILNGYSERTIKGWLYYIIQYRNYLQKKQLSVKKIRYDNAIDYVEYLSKNNKPHSINCNLLALRQYYNYLKVKVNPFQGMWIKNDRRVVFSKIIEKDQLIRLYQNWDQSTWIEQRNKSMIGLLVFQGIHPTELSTLTKGHVQLQNGSITIPSSKRINERTLPLHPIQILDFHQYIERIKSDQLFTSKEGNSQLNNVLQKLTQKVKGKDKRIHSLQHIRKCVIVDWIKKYDLRKVQYMCGHKHISSTEKYRVHDHDKLKEDVIKYHPME